MPTSMAAITVPGRLPMPPSTQIAKTRPIYSRPTDGSTGWMMIRNAPASEAVAIEMPKAIRLMRIGSIAKQLERELILRHSHDGAADEGAREHELQRRDHQERHQARYQNAQRNIEIADVPGWADIGRFDVAIINAEIEHQRHLGDEKKPEEKRQAAHRFLAAFFERNVINLIDAGTQRIECRCGDNRGEDRIEPEGGVDDVGDVGAEDNERRMGDVDDVENAER